MGLSHHIVGIIMATVLGMAVISSGAFAEVVKARFVYETHDKTVYFEDTSLGANIVSWEWDFGDRNYSRAKDPVHTYAGYGNYSVVLRITTSVGEVNWTRQIVDVARPGTEVPPTNPTIVFAIFLMLLGFMGAALVRNPYTRVVLAAVGFFGVIWAINI